MSRDSMLFVRPFGYVSETPVCRRVPDTDLFVGNAAVAHDPPGGCARVVSLTRAPVPATTHHRPLTDDDENDWPAFAAAVDAARGGIRAEGGVLVHCEAGVSRSSAVAAAALASEHATTFVAALHRVQAARPHAVPHPAVHELGVTYVAARGERTDRRP